MRELGQWRSASRTGRSLDPASVQARATKLARWRSQGGQPRRVCANSVPADSGIVRLGTRADLAAEMESATDFWSGQRKRIVRLADSHGDERRCVANASRKKEPPASNGGGPRFPNDVLACVETSRHPQQRLSEPRARPARLERVSTRLPRSFLRLLRPRDRSHRRVRARRALPPCHAAPGRASGLEGA